MEIKEGEIYSYMGSTSLGIVVEKASHKNADDQEQVWLSPVCGTDRWMNPLRGDAWLIDVDKLREVPNLEKELCRFLFGI